MYIYLLSCLLGIFVKVYDDIIDLKIQNCSIVLEVSKIIIIISKKSRPLDSRFLYPIEHTKEELQQSLIEYFPNNKNEISLMTKGVIIKKINDMVSKNILRSITAEQSLKIWKIYISP